MFEDDPFESATGAFLKGGAGNMITIGCSSLFSTVSALITKVQTQETLLVNLANTVVSQQDEIGRLAEALSQSKVEQALLRAELKQQQRIEGSAEVSQRTLVDAADSTENINNLPTTRIDTLARQVADISQIIQAWSADFTLFRSRLDDLEKAMTAVRDDPQETYQPLPQLHQPTSQALDVTALRRSVRAVASDIDALYALLGVTKEETAAATADDAEVVDRVKLLHGTPAFHLLLAELFHMSQIATGPSYGGGGPPPHETVSLSQIGLEVQEARGRRGMLVFAVTRGSCAAEAGLQMGDILVGLNDQAIDNITQLHQALSRCLPGTLVKISSIPCGRIQPMTVQMVIPSLTPPQTHLISPARGGALSMMTPVRMSI